MFDASAKTILNEVHTMTWSLRICVTLSPGWTYNKVVLIANIENSKNNNFLQVGRQPEDTEDKDATRVDNL